MSFILSMFVVILSSVFMLGCSVSQHAGLAEINKDKVITDISSDMYATRASALLKLISYGEKTPLSDEFIDALLRQLAREPDWRIKVRIISTLGCAENKQKILPILIQCLSDRDPDSGGSGQVPSTAASVLSRVGDVAAIDPLDDWIQYLRKNPYPLNDKDGGREYNESMLGRNVKYLSILKENKGKGVTPAKP